MKKLYLKDNKIIFSRNGKIIRTTDVKYIPYGYEGLEDQALAEWGQANVYDTIASIPFFLFTEERKLNICHSSNAEYKLELDGTIEGYRDRFTAEKRINEILEREGVHIQYALRGNPKYDMNERGYYVIDSIPLD